MPRRSKMTTSTRIFTFLHRRKNYRMIPPILEKVRVMVPNLILQRYPPDCVFIKVKKSPLPKKRLRDQNHIWLNPQNQSPMINHRAPYLSKPLAQIKKISRYLKTTLMTLTSWIPSLNHTRLSAKKWEAQVTEAAWLTTRSIWERTWPSTPR